MAVVLHRRDDGVVSLVPRLVVADDCNPNVRGHLRVLHAPSVARCRHRALGLSPGDVSLYSASMGSDSDALNPG